MRHNKFTADLHKTRGKRYATRRANKLHKKNLTGNFFIRTCNFEMIDKQSDVRVYGSLDNDEALETEEQAREWYDATVNVTRGAGIAVQLFTSDNKIVAESLSLYPEMPEGTTAVSVGDELFQRIMESIRRCGKGFSYSKHGQRREIQLYDGEPREFHAGLPLRPIFNMKDLAERKDDWLAGVGKESHLYPFLKVAKEKGMNYDVAYTYAFAEFHASQGRAREVVPECHRPLANCACCHKRESWETRFKTCNACKMVLYCCKECQEADWPNHKTFCKQNRNTTEISDVVD